MIGRLCTHFRAVKSPPRKGSKSQRARREREKVVSFSNPSSLISVITYNCRIILQIVHFVGSSSMQLLLYGLQGFFIFVQIFVAEMAESKSGLRKPVFTKVDQLRPGTSGHTLTVKVVDSKIIRQKGRADGPQSRQPRIAECLVGDETGMIVFTARNDQVELMKADATVVLRNAKIDMYRGSMRLAVDKWGRVEVTDPADFTVKEDNNLSLIEYELVSVVEE